MKKAPAEIVKQPESKPSVSSDSEAAKTYGKNEAVAIVKQLHSNLKDLCENAPNDHFRTGLSSALSIISVIVKLCEHVPEDFWDD